MPYEMIHVNELDGGKVPKDSLIILGQIDPANYLRGIRRTRLVKPEGLVVQLFPVEIDGKSLLAAMGICHSMPEELCEITIDSRPTPGYDGIVHHFDCECTFGGGPTGDSGCKLVFAGTNPDCIADGCGGVCHVVGGPMGGLGSPFAVQCACLPRADSKLVIVRKRFGFFLSGLGDRLVG